MTTPPKKPTLQQPKHEKGKPVPIHTKPAAVPKFGLQKTPKR
ncbi:MAG: hypothetical protein AB7V45_04270 [Candidatus Krumholzibacteriia bacterium]